MDGIKNTFKQITILFVLTIFALGTASCGRMTSLFGNAGSTGSFQQPPSNPNPPTNPSVNSIFIQSGDAQTATVDATLPSQFVAIVKDQQNTVVPGASIDWTVATGSANLQTASTLTDSSGLSTNQLTMGPTTGAVTITATIHGTSTFVTFHATGTNKPGSQLVYVTQPNGGKAGASWTQQPIVQIKDVHGNLVTTGSDATSSITLTLTTGSGALAGTNVVAASNGVVTFSGLSMNLVGNNKVLTATASLSAGTKTATSSAFTITAGNASQISVSGGNNQTGNAGQGLATAMAVVVQDSFSNLVSGTTIDWSVSTGDGTLGSSSSSTNASGIASMTFTLGTTSPTIKATIHGTSAFASFQQNITPKVASTSTTLASGTYGAGQIIPITITFNKAVTVTGTPQLQLNLGGTNLANYASGSGSANLTFNYTVGAADSSSNLDYSSASALTLNGGTIKDSNGTNAVLTLPTPGSSGSISSAKTIVIGTPPSPRSVTLAWDKTTSSNVTGYKLYYGPASGDYTVTVDMAVPGDPNNPTYQLMGLDPTAHYFFAVTAYSSSDESGYSNEVGI